MRARLTSCSQTNDSKPLAIAVPTPMRITPTEPYQGIGDSFRGSGLLSTLSPHFGHSLDEAGKRILQLGQ